MNWIFREIKEKKDNTNQMIIDSLVVVHLLPLLELLFAHFRFLHCSPHVQQSHQEDCTGPRWCLFVTAMRLNTNYCLFVWTWCDPLPLSWSLHFQILLSYWLCEILILISHYWYISKNIRPWFSCRTDAGWVESDGNAEDLCQLSPTYLITRSAGGRPALIKTPSPINKVLELA